MRLVLWLSAVLLVATPAHANVRDRRHRPRKAVTSGSRSHRRRWRSAPASVMARLASVYRDHRNCLYKRRALQLLRSGLSAQQVVDRLLTEDTFENGDNRQVVIIDTEGQRRGRVGAAARPVNGVPRGQTYAVIGTGVIGSTCWKPSPWSSREAAANWLNGYAALKAGPAGGDRQPDTATALLVIRKQRQERRRVRVGAGGQPRRSVP